MAQSTTVAIYATHEQADTAVKALQKSGFDLRKLSIVGKDFRTEEHALGYYNTGDRVRFWGRTGAFWGGLAGILFSSAFLIIPVVGHVIVLGPLVTSLIGGLEGAAAGGGEADAGGDGGGREGAGGCSTGGAAWAIATPSTAAQLANAPSHSQRARID